MKAKNSESDSATSTSKRSPIDRLFSALGENWEIYLLTGILLMSVLGIAGHYLHWTDAKNPAEVIPVFQKSLTFLIVFLCALGIHLLRHEHKNKQLHEAANQQLTLVSQSLADLAQRINSPGRGGFDEGFPEHFLTRLSTAKDVLQIGIHLSSNLTDYHKNYTDLLTSGGNLRILIVKPNGSALKMASLRFPAAQTADSSQETARATASLRGFSDFKGKFPKQVSIKVLDYLFSHSVTCIDTETSNGIFYVERYTFRTQGGARKPKFVFEKSDRRMFELFKNESDALWAAGEDYQP